MEILIISTCGVDSIIEAVRCNHGNDDDFFNQNFYFELMHILTQAMMDCLVSPPQPGDESYDTFIKVSVRVQLRE